MKSNALNMRKKKLINIKNAITDLKQRIRLSHDEIDKLIAVSFKNISDIYSNLEKNDHEIIKNFFKDIGMSDTKAELERCELCISLLNTQIAEAEKNCVELGKLYKNIGLLSGIFICILFL
jgi:stage III sporulation protein AB